MPDKMRPETFSSNADWRVWRQFYDSLARDYHGAPPWSFLHLTLNAYHYPDTDLCDFLYWTPRWHMVSHKTLCLAYAFVESQCSPSFKADCHTRFALVCKHRGW